MKDFIMVGVFFIAFSLYGVACFELGKGQVIVVTAPAIDLDKQCSAWLFDSNLKEAKKRICKK